VCMGKRGPKPKGKVDIRWSSDFSYAIGLLVTDGSLSKNGRHINLTSKDLEMIKNFLRALKVDAHIGRKSNGANKERRYYVVQIGDVLFFNFLKTIGLMPNKTKVIREVTVPQKYFRDFLRGHFDGDGSVYSYFDPRWRSSFMFYSSFVSASKNHINWLRSLIFKNVGTAGNISRAQGTSCYQLKYAKKESIGIFRFMYYKRSVRCLSRKRLKVEKILSILHKLDGRKVRARCLMSKRGCCN